MKLESQVVSLKLSKRLKELGVKQESIFVWEYYDDQCHGVKFIPYAVVPDNYNKFELYSAFTVAELGEMIPAYIGNEQEYLFTAYKFDTGYGSDHTHMEDGIAYSFADTFDMNEANSRAKLLIYLLENKLMELPI